MNKCGTSDIVAVLDVQEEKVVSESMPLNCCGIEKIDGSIEFSWGECGAGDCGTKKKFGEKLGWAC